MEWHFSKELSKIRFGEFDSGGVLHHSRYFNILEELREEYFRSINQPYELIVKDGFHLPLSDAKIKFIKPIRYGAPVIGHLRMEIIGQTRILCIQELQDPVNTIYSRAETTHVLVKVSKDGSSFKPTKVLDYLKLPVTNVNEP
jgi:acyl-CoA thioester hydrolase